MKTVKIGRYYYEVSEEEILKDEWMYDESPEGGLEHIRKCSFSSHLGGGYYKITSTTDKKLVNDGIEKMLRIKKFNGGARAILCSKCHVIIKEGWADETNPEPNRITKKDWESNKPLYCEECQEKIKRFK